MTFPKHIKCVPGDRKAVAPYNFVELPEKVVAIDPGSLPGGDRYHPGHQTGIIKCTLTTESPLYTRCGWTPDDFAKDGDTPFHELPSEIKQKQANFFLDPITQKPVIPGSSIRGMLRTLVEIISFSKINQVSDVQKFFFRAVAAEREDPLEDPYKKTLKKVQAGYLVKKGDEWFIRPAKKVDDLSFIWVKDKLVKDEIDDFIPLNSEDYYPQYKINISFEDTFTKNGRRFARKISAQPSEYKYVGVLVTSGNMAETGEASQTNRKNHCLVQEPDSESQLLKISDESIRDYCSALTTFQKKSPHFTEQEGFLKKGRCVFYCVPQRIDQCVTLFGQSPYFRIPYLPKGNSKAATARDFIPPQLKDSEGEQIVVDVAEAIFGFLGRGRQAKNNQRSRIGRIFISSGVLQTEQEEKIQQSLNQEPKEILLSSPKPTTFQHYLVQTEAQRKELKHYASSPLKDDGSGETAIRGHKLYWHKPYAESDLSATSDTQTSLIKPLDLGLKFSFDIRFENLSSAELGALLWILSLSNDKSEQLQTGKIDEKYWLSLGMGKPLGMGAVIIDYELHLSNRPQRYQNLFESFDWEKSERIVTIQEQQSFVSDFESFVLRSHSGISENDHPQGKTATKLREVPRIEMLLAMLRCDLPNERVDHMDLDGFKERKVLPNPLDIRDIPDQRRLSRGNNSPSERSGRSHYPTVSPPAVQFIRPEASPFSEGQQIEAKVVDIQVQEGKKKKTTITYEIDGSDCFAREEVYKKEVILTTGDTVKVIIDKVQGESIRKVKHLQRD